MKLMLDAGMLIEEAEKISDPEAAGISDAIIQFNLTGNGGGIFYYKIRQGKVSAYSGSHGSPDVTIITDVETWTELILGKIRPIRTYLTGKVKVEGDIVLAQKVIKLFQNADCLKQRHVQDISGNALYIVGTDISPKDRSSGFREVSET